MRRDWMAIACVATLAAVLAWTLAGRGATSAATARAGDTGGASYRLDADAAEREGVRHLDDPLRAATLRFAAGVAPQDQRLVLDAVAAAQPDARRLIELVDGLVLFRVGAPASGAIGQAAPMDGGAYEVTIDLPTLWHAQGPRGVTNVVLHELAHVVDGVLLGDDVIATLDAGIPAGQGCDEWHRGACAPPEERFADTFAKWATGDLGFELYVGYRIPPPTVPLQRWGEPLAAFGR